MARGSGLSEPIKIDHNFFNLFTPDMLHGIEVTGFGTHLTILPYLIYLSYLVTGPGDPI
jgi:hypothetical protein